MHKIKLTLIFLSCFLFQTAQAKPTVSVTEDEFIQNMQTKHGFDTTDLEKVFQEAKVSKSILKAISRPAEKKLPWYKYRNIFIKEKRIKQGVDFWLANKAKLMEAEARFGVPAEIIIAIIGVETFYGGNKGSYRVVDALNTLAFHYPKRSNFFRSEFEQFLLLAREQGFDPLSLKGSYAGAMGLPQFISSSYRHYAIDFDGDEVIDIWNNPDDAIGSVANYFAEHGWQKGKQVINQVKVTGTNHKRLISKGLKPDLAISDLKDSGIVSNTVYEQDEKLKLFEFEFENKSEYWLAHKNFYVITRYNHSELYAMAVFELSNNIADRIKSLELTQN